MIQARTKENVNTKNDERWLVRQSRGVVALVEFVRSSPGRFQRMESPLSAQQVGSQHALLQFPYLQHGLFQQVSQKLQGVRVGLVAAAEIT